MTRPEILQVQGTTPGKDNDPEWPQLSYGPGRVPRRPERARVALPWQALALLLAFVLIVLGFGWWRYESYCAAWNNPCWWHAPAITNALVLAGVVGVFGWVVARLRIWHAQAEAERNEARQLAVRTNRYGDAEPLALYEQPIQEAAQFFMARYLAATQLERDIAPHKRYSGVETLNEGAHTEIRTDLAPPEPTLQLAPPQLPAGPLLLGLRQKAHRSGEHLLVGFSEGDTPVYLRWGLAGLSAVAGGSGSGKTSTVRLIAAWHALNGGGLVVLDPHGRKEEGLVNTIAPLAPAFLYEPAVSEEAILQTMRAVDRVCRRRIHGEESTEVPILVVFDEFTSACRNFRSAPELVNLLLNFGDEYRGVNAQALVVGHHWRGDILDPRLGGALRSAIGTRIIQRIAPSEAKFLVTAREAQGIDRLQTGEALFFDGTDDPLRLVVPFVDAAALAEATYPKHVGWPLPVAIPRTNGGAPDPLAELRTVARRTLDHLGGDRERAAVALLAAKGAAVRGRYAYRVRDVARVLNLRDETIARCAARAGRNGAE